MDVLLVINAGSSSIKFQAYDAGDLTCPHRILKGQIDGIGTSPRLRAEDAEKTPLTEESYSRDRVPDLASAMRIVANWLRDTQRATLVAAGHRVVHGGPLYDRATVVTADAIAKLERLAPLAPLHQPHNLAPIRALLKSRPDLPQVACFDTAFHRGHSSLADYYALPRRFHDEGVRRYGFHGLSYEYIAARLREIAPAVANRRIVVAHLGSGASMCAMFEGRSVESTLGFTALDGLPMGTRPGQLDPGVVVYLMQQKGMSAAEIQKFLYGECGLKGLSGVSNDVRTLESSVDPNAAFALDYFVYRVGLYAGMLAAALGGLDAFVFTAGIGENSVRLRSRIAANLAWLGAKLDAKANAAGELLISSPESRVALYVIPTDEELMIARHTVALLSEGKVRQPTEGYA